MEIHNSSKHIFKKGSKTFFYSSLFFPKKIKEEVGTLYAFVRTADDYVDSVPQDRAGFEEFCHKYRMELKGVKSNNSIIENFVNLQKLRSLDQAFVDSFLYAMESDLGEQVCVNLAETEKYMYGSAEVVGLMICKILGIDKSAYPAAQKLGQAFQYINFIRDIKEDNDLGRIYLPKEGYIKYGLADLSYDEVKSNKTAFEGYLREQIEYFYSLIKEGKKGFAQIPVRYRVPIAIATNLYMYTAKEIHKRPLIVYKKKLKPSIPRILLEAFKVIIKK